MTMTRPQGTEFLRRPKHDMPLEIDIGAVAIAHHRLYCEEDDKETCVLVDESDLEYAELLAEVLALLPAWPTELTVRMPS